MRILYQACLDRIFFDIRLYAQECSPIHYNSRIEPVSPDMAPIAIYAIIGLCENPHDPPHNRRKVFIPTRPEYKMIVVPEDTEILKGKIVLAFSSLDRLQKEVLDPVGTENHLVAIGPGHYMIAGPG